MSLDIEMLKQINSQGKTNEEGEITGGTKEKEETTEAQATEESSLKEEVQEETQVAEEKVSQPTATNEAEETTTEATKEVEKEVETVNWEDSAKESGWMSKDDLEDLKQEWEDEHKPQEKEYSPFVQSIIDAEAKGHTVDNAAYWKFQTEDIGATAAKAKTDFEVGIDMIADAMILDDPNAPEGELKEMLRRKYRNMLSGDYESTEPEYKDDEFDYNSSLRKAEAKLKGFQSEWKLPQNPVIAENAEQEEYKKQIETATPKAERQFKREVNKYFENNKAYSYDVGGKDFQYELSKKDIASLSEDLNSMIKNVPQLITPNGLDKGLIKEDTFSKRVEEILWNNKETRDVLISKYAEHKAAQTLEEDVKVRMNTKAPQANGSKTEKVIKSDFQKLREQMAKNPAFR